MKRRRAPGDLRACMICAIAAGGCVRQLPPPAVPEAVVPDVPAPGPSPEGLGRLIVDVVDGPTTVTSATREPVMVDVDKGVFVSASSVSRLPLCETPCVIDLPLGRHTLAFPVLNARRQIDLDTVEVGAHPSVYRRALGRYERPGAGMVLGLVGVALGGSSIITGAAVLPTGVATDNDAMALGGGITLAAGGVITALGIVGIVLSPATEQPGASIQFPLP